MTVAITALLVAGGGGGGASYGGGGGGGGVQESSITPSYGIYDIVIGNGGTSGTKGGITSLGALLTVDGGGKGGANGYSGGTGGNGGGGAGTSNYTIYEGLGGLSTTAYGYAGGEADHSGNHVGASGGGGGAGAVGGLTSSYNGGNGGAGLSNSITGIPIKYAGGGGGFHDYSAGTGGNGSDGGGNGTGANGTVNTGGGGGGGGGTGGSGVLIIRYTTVGTAFTFNGNYTTGVDGSSTWVKMTSSGVLNLIEVTTPDVTTDSINSISQSSIVVNGNLVDNGGWVDEIGFVWATTINPTIADNKVIVLGGTVLFSSLVSGFTANTAYHIRAYAKNTADTVYGSDIAFTTLASGPMVKRRISFLSKAQSLTIQLSNNAVDETFTVLQFAVTGDKQEKKTFAPAGIVSIN